MNELSLLDREIKFEKNLKYGFSGDKVDLIKIDEKYYIRKTSRKEKLKDQYNWMLEHKNLEFIGNVLDWKEVDGCYCYVMEYYHDNIELGDYLIRASLDQRKKVLEGIIRAVNENIHKNRATKSELNNLIKYIDLKLVNNLDLISESLGEESMLYKLLHKSEVKINKKTYMNSEKLCEYILGDITFLEELCSCNQIDTHGDLTTQNILINKSGNFKLIDANPVSPFNDCCTEYSKISQSLHSQFENILHSSVLCQSADKFIIDYTFSETIAGINDFFESFVFDMFSIPKWKLYFHEGIHFARILPYALNHNKENLPIIYLRMIELFGKSIEEYEN